MLKKHKNGFIDLIKEAGLEPLSFKRHEKEVDGCPAFILKLKGSPLSFMARSSQDDFHLNNCRYIEFAPSFPKTDYLPLNENGYPRDDWSDIEFVYKSFKDWLEKDVKEYLEDNTIPDLWEQIEGKTLFSIDPIHNKDFSKFNQVEKERVIASIDHLRELIKIEYEPTKDQMESINDRLQYLSDSVERLNKVDWQGIAISTVLSISIALGLDTAKGKRLFILFERAFTTLVEIIKHDIPI